MKNQRKDGRFQKWVTIGKDATGKPIRRIVYGDTAEELAEKAEALKRDAALGKVGAKAPTFSSMAESWLMELSKEKSKSTVTGYRSYLNRFLLPALGQKPMAEITAEDVNRVLERARAEQYSPSSLTQIRAAALRVADFARNNGITLGQPWDEISPGNTKKPNEQRTLTEDEICRMLTKDKGHSMCLPALLMLLCGLRGTEIRALRWEDIDRKAGTLQVNKALVNSKFSPELQPQPGRVIPMPKQLLKRLPKPLPREGLVCPNRKGGFMTNNELQTAWTSYLRFLYDDSAYDRRTLAGREATKIRASFATQNLRLTYGKMLFAQGLHVMEVKYLLGLSTPEAAMQLAERFLEVDGERMKKSLHGLYASNDMTKTE